MSRITTTVVTLLLTTAAFGQAKDDAGDGKKLDKQTMEIKDYLPEIHGTIRGKYEYQTETGESRFEVRNARFSVSGNVHPLVAYKAEIDLSDEGSIKMLDAYARVFPVKDLNFTIGQMRVPFTIDAHRSPHLSLIHISEPTRQAEISYAVFCLKKKKTKPVSYTHTNNKQQPKS